MNINREAELKEINKEYERTAQQYRAGRLNNAQLLKAQKDVEQRRRDIDRAYGFTNQFED